MKHHRLLLWVGIIVLALPFLGIPQTWKHLILFIIGLTFISLSLIARREQRAVTKGQESVYVENEDTPLYNMSDIAPPAFAGDYTSQYNGRTIISEDASHRDATNVYAAEMVTHDHVVYTDDALSDATSEQAAPTDVFGFGEELVQDVVAPKKPRKKRVAKKSPIQEDVERTMLVSADIIEDIDQPVNDER